MTTNPPRPGRRAVMIDVVMATLASVVLARLAPHGAGDPFAGVVRVLPFAVAGLRGVARGLPWRARPLEGRVLGVLLLFWVVLTVRRRELALAIPDPVIAGGYLVLLGAWLGRLLPGLRAALGPRLPARPPAAFFLLPLLVYWALLPWSNAQRPPDGDEPYYLLLTHSVAYDLDLDLANNYADEDWRWFVDRPLEPQPGDPVGPRGERFSRHNALLPVVLAPAYRLGGLAAVLAMMSAMAAATAWLVLRLAHHLAPWSLRGALLAYLVFAFSPPMVLYSQQVWIEVPAGLLLVFGVDRVLALQRRDATVTDGLVLAAVAVALPMLKLRLGLLALPLLALAALRIRRWRALAPTLVATTLALVAVLAMNQSRFANPLKMHRWDELLVLDHPPEAFVLGGLGMLYDVAFGLFGAAPIWLLLLPAVALAIVRRSRPVAALACLALPYWLMLAPRFEWYGGWSPPFRYPLVLLPLLALLLVPLFERRSAGTRLVGGTLALWSGALTVLWLAVPGWTYNLADGGTHLLDAAGLRLGQDVARFFPSMVRPRLATWLWPALSLLVVPLALARKAPRRPSWQAIAATAPLLVLVLAIGRVRSTTLELEDGHVVHRGGALHPPPWTVERPRYRGGWTLLPGNETRAPVVGRGPVVLSMAVRYLDNDPNRTLVLEIAAGDTVLTRWSGDDGDGWQQVDFGPFDWPDDEPLVLRGQAPSASGGQHDAVIVDYVELHWRATTP